MFTTPENVKRATGKEVTADQVYKAQFIIEIYIGRSESDIRNGRDRGALERAAIAQTVYMMNNYDQVYEQVAAAVISNGDSSTTFKSGDGTAPWLAPLAVIACTQLSWFKSRSVRTGKTNQRSGKHPFLEGWLFG